MPKIEPEETLSSDVAFSGRLVEVRINAVRLPDGRKSKREIVVHPPVVAILPILKDGRIVMVRQFRNAAGKILLEVPAGSIEPGETAVEAAHRELREETGYQTANLRAVSAFFTSPGFTTEYMHLFEATDLTEGEAESAADETIELVIMSPEEAWESVRAAQVEDAKTLLALCLAGRQ